MIHNINYCLKLICDSSHLLLPISCRITHQRPFNNVSRGNQSATSNGRTLHHQQTRKHYYKSDADDMMHSKMKENLISKKEHLKLHQQLEHVTATQMKLILRDAQE